MAVHTYDCTVILDSNKYARDPHGMAEELKQIFTTHGGEVLVSRLWEDRRLAYPIDGHRKGAYWITFFKADPLKVAKIERDLQLSESVIRSLTLKVDSRIADALVAQAKGDRPIESRAPKADPVLGDSFRG